MVPRNVQEVRVYGAEFCKDMQPQPRVICGTNLTCPVELRANELPKLIWNRSYESLAHEGKP